MVPPLTTTPTPSIPPEARKWNWGAFFLTWIWGIGNNVLIAFLVFIPFMGFIMPIILGIKGSEWAWQNKRWESIEQFQRVQRTWAWIGFATSFLGILIMIWAGTYIVHLFQAMLNSGSFEMVSIHKQSI
ncbi:MAG: ribonuclease G [Deltaproteobacteria bacterium CG11_big_fil_rev_8_21_14_0_20_47_16]|nr:MAG: ribonuclease G [Deltaproteobacteria bacterium CG11_big_fil_rev_8_21_14_0_20_47_16]